MHLRPQVPAHLRRPGMFRLELDVIYPGDLRTRRRAHLWLLPQVRPHADRLPPRTVRGRPKSARGIAGIGAPMIDVHGENGAPDMRTMSESYVSRHGEMGYRTGIMGAGALPAVSLEMKGKIRVECAAFHSQTDYMWPSFG